MVRTDKKIDERCAKEYVLTFQSSEPVASMHINNLLDIIRIERERKRVLEDALEEIAKEVDSKHYQINLGQWDFEGVEYKAVVMSEEAWGAIKNALKKAGMLDEG